jgi:hypothetical protein
MTFLRPVCGCREAWASEVVRAHSKKRFVPFNGGFGNQMVDSDGAIRSAIPCERDPAPRPNGGFTAIAANTSKPSSRRALGSGQSTWGWFGYDIWLECTRSIGRLRGCRSGLRLKLDVPLMGFFASSEFSGFWPIRFVFGDGQGFFRGEEKLSDFTNLPPSSRT